MLARRFTTILPAMTLGEAIEATRIHRVAGRTGADTALVTTRPCRALHQTISDVGLIGGATCRCPVKCRWPTVASSSWMSCRSSSGTSSKCYASRKSRA
jgi:predicted ATPase with chaperone activity